jgi:hypothetical protein
MVSIGNGNKVTRLHLSGQRPYGPAEFAVDTPVTSKVSDHANRGIAYFVDDAGQRGATGSQLPDKVNGVAVVITDMSPAPQRYEHGASFSIYASPAGWDIKLQTEPQPGQQEVVIDLKATDTEGAGAQPWTVANAQAAQYYMGQLSYTVRAEDMGTPVTAFDEASLFPSQPGSA